MIPTDPAPGAGGQAPGAPRRARRLALLAVVAGLLAMHLAPLNKLGTGYIEQQWVINYASGFLRRGLFGEILRQAGLGGALPGLYAFFRALITVAYLGYAATVYRHILQRQLLAADEILVVLLAPLGWAFLSKMDGRFDTLFDVVVLGILWLEGSRWQVPVLLALSVPLGLVHEIWFVLYLPFLGCWLLARGRRGAGAGALAIAACGLLALSLATPRPPTDVQAVCAGINVVYAALGKAQNCAAWSLLTSTQALGPATLDNVFRGQAPGWRPLLENLLEFGATVAYLLAACWPLADVLYRRLSLAPRALRYVLPTFALSLGLCVIALDWGRFLLDGFFLCLLGVLAGGDAAPRPAPPGARPATRALRLALTLGLAKLPLTKILLF